MAEFQDNISKIKQKYRNPQDRDEIDNIEQQMHDLVLEQEFSKHPVVQFVITSCKGQVSAINEQLLDDPEADRKVLIAQKNCYLWFIRLFAKNYEEEIKLLNQEVESRL